MEKHCCFSWTNRSPPAGWFFLSSPFSQTTGQVELRTYTPTIATITPSTATTDKSLLADINPVKLKLIIFDWFFDNLNLLPDNESKEKLY